MANISVNINSLFLCFKEDTRLLQEINYFVYSYSKGMAYIYRVYLLFGGEYQIYFIEYGEKISIFTSTYFISNGKYRKPNLTFSLLVSHSI